MDKEIEQVSEKKLTVPNEFPFPFVPYSIQLDFMKALYEAIDERKIGIFESPTGTGKSLSLICGSLTWLKDHENRLENEASVSPVKCCTSNSKEPSWILDFEEKQKLKAKTHAAKSSSEVVSKRNQMFKKIRSGADVLENQKKSFKRKRNEDETEFLMKMAKKDLDNYDNNCSNESDLDNMAFALDDYNSEDDENVSEELDERFTRIYYCSRTHSQLSQFVHEVQKSPFADSSTEFPVTVATLGSRNNLCVNEDVKKLKSVQQMNETCLEMQKNSTKKKENEGEEMVKKKRRKKSKTKCEYYQNSDGIASLTNTILRQVGDIEDIVAEGKKTCACPYYAARKASFLSHLVVLPYQTLLHEKTRELSGIDIKDSVIIIDEAHNLVEAINQMYSCQFTQGQVDYAYNQINQYLQKFNTRLKAKNFYYIKQLIFVLQQFKNIISKSVKSQSSILTANEFLFNSKLDNINFFKLLRYCQRSMLAKKLMGFTEHYKTNKPDKKSTLSAFLNEIKPTEEPANNKVVVKSPLMIIESFFSALSSSSKNGRVIMTCNENNESIVKYNLLNPAENFKVVLDQARSIIVAGGTMQPSSSLINQLIGENHKSRITEFSCGHVIEGANQLLPIALPKGPGEIAFDFTFENRKSLKLIDELGRLLVNFCNIVPGGIVCFFPSYNYEKVVYERWNNSRLIQRLEAKKKIFREPKKSSEVNSVLQGYDSCIKNSKTNPGKLNGSLLLCVVGGKMSEGINFADELGRLVVMVGMPYPNLHSPELKEKMAYLNGNMPKINGVNAGQVFYENACMKGVNQSIGRAIRHKNDYASILLLDKRYSNTKVIKQLPSWISQHLVKGNSFSTAFSSVKQFFGKHKTK